MGRIRALPKKLLTEQAYMVTEEISPEKDVVLEAPGARLELPEDQAPKPPMPSGQEEPKSTGDLPSPTKKTQPTPVSPIPQEDLPLATGQTSQPSGPVSSSKAQEFQALDQGDERSLTGVGRDFFSSDQAMQEEKAPGSMAKTARSSAPQYLSQQILVWQNAIQAHPRGEELGQAYFRLSEAWYQLALLTAQREDLLQAVEAQRAALDFATEDAARSLLRSRIQALEEQLRKK
jgi:hypothetical protein